ncbi:MAG: NUDIX domain-containing protein [Solirubrobacterales bacterium]
MSDKKSDVQVLARDTVFQGYFRIDKYRLKHRTFAGGWTDEITRELFERGHAVAVLLYDPVRDEVALIEQFRVGALAAGWNPWLIEVVAGIIDDGEPPDDVARREVQEEAGCSVDELVHIMDVIVSPGAVSETVRLYCARVDCTALGGLHGLEHEGEDIRVFTVAADEAVRMAKDGRINNSIAIISMLWLASEREALKARWSA